MRTTLSLDDDNAVRLERLRKQRDAGLKEVVNDVIRRGLDVLEARVPAPERRLPEPIDLGLPLFPSLKEALVALDDVGDKQKLVRP